MTLTEDNLITMGFTANSVSVDDGLYFFSVIDWLRQNTDFAFSDDVVESDIASLPASAKLFIVKYIQMLKNGILDVSNVTSESIGGMSKSYGTTAEGLNKLWLLARQLLGKHFLGGWVTSIGTYSRWQ